MHVPITLCGETLFLDPLGGAFWPAESALLVSDLHFEKGSSYASKGILLPPYDTKTTLKRLETLCQRYRPETIISLGDAFHDRKAEDRMDQADSGRLNALMADRNWIWVLGNHDPEPSRKFSAAWFDEYRCRSLVFRHEPLAEGDLAYGEVCGHLHPCAKLMVEGRTLRRRCFVGDGPQPSRLILPAIGAYTGGLNVLDAAFARYLPDPQVWAMGDESVFQMPAHCLVPDGGRVSASRRRAAV